MSANPKLLGVDLPLSCTLRQSTSSYLRISLLKWSPLCVAPSMDMDPAMNSKTELSSGCHIPYNNLWLKAGWRHKGVITHTRVHTHTHTHPLQNHLPFLPPPPKMPALGNQRLLLGNLGTTGPSFQLRDPRTSWAVAPPQRSDFHLHGAAPLVI